MKRRALLLINPRARRGDQARRQVWQELTHQGFELLEESAEIPERLPTLIQNHRERIDLVIVGGGDGTVNAAIEGLLETRLPLGVLPLGTANNLARSLGIPSSLIDACRVIAQGTLQPIDLGWVNGEYFFNVAGIGLSTQINRTVPKGLKRRWGVIAYILTALRLILQQPRFEAEITCGHQVLSVRTYQITICNGRYYGSGLMVAADAAINDSRLDLCSFEMQPWWTAISVLPALSQGKFTEGRGVRTLHGPEITIRTRRPYPIDTDGEVVTQTPATFRVIPQAIQVFAPHATGNLPSL
ncbi:MAG: lipid kinase [Synechococcales cyanobacterium C42_A2020_086]|nr:lipid kinase [Synechococcales cyanobacterium C42_A2020_086]